MSTDTISFIALTVSLVALLISFFAWRLKWGQQIRGRHSVFSGIACDDKYVGKIWLENMKDRAVTIFGIHFRVGRNHYIELALFEETPLILQPFETYQQSFDPIAFYEVGMKRIMLNTLLDDEKTKKQIVLSTSKGKCLVRPMRRGWTPVHDFFRNHSTAVIHPVRSKFNGRGYGSNVKFLVDFEFENERREVIAVHPGDHAVYRFRDFLLTQDSLRDTESLQEFLQEKVDAGMLVCKSFEVQNLEEWRGKAYKLDEMRVLQGEKISWFRYSVLGFLATRLHSRMLRKRNREAAKAAKFSGKEKGSS